MNGVIYDKIVLPIQTDAFLKWLETKRWKKILMELELLLPR